MQKTHVLVVSDEAVRRNFIEGHLKMMNLEPVSYPNFLSAKKALTLDQFGMVVIDFQMPLEQKLALLEEACKRQADATIMTVEKVEYLKTTGILTTHPEIISLDSIAAFQEGLRHVREQPGGIADSE